MYEWLGGGEWGEVVCVVWVPGCSVYGGVDVGPEGDTGVTVMPGWLTAGVVVLGTGENFVTDFVCPVGTDCSHGVGISLCSVWVYAVAAGTGGAGLRAVEVSVCSGTGWSISADGDDARALNINC